MPNGSYDSRRLSRNEKITSQPRRPVQARGGGRSRRYQSNHNYRTIRGNDTGYNLRKRNINFAGKRGGVVGRAVTTNPRPWIIGLAAILCVGLLAFGVSRCVRSCSQNRERTEANERDARVAAGTSEELTTELAEALDRAEALEAIAAHATAYDQRLVRLAITQPDAIEFVASYDADAEHEALPYETKVTKGYYTPLYCWDSRWGASDFAGGPMALTGSGPTTLFMAYLGLTGKTDITPSDIAAKVAEAGLEDTMLGFAPSYLTSGATTWGLSISPRDVSADNIAEVLDAGTVVILQTKAGGVFGDEPHWALATGENADGTVNVYDPTSPAVSKRPWAASSIASGTDAMFATTTGTLATASESDQ